MIKNRIWGVPFYGMHNSENDIMVRYYVLQDVLDHGMEYIKWSSLKKTWVALKIQGVTSSDGSDMF